MIRGSASLQALEKLRILSPRIAPALGAGRSGLALSRGFQGLKTTGRGSSSSACFSPESGACPQETLRSSVLDLPAFTVTLPLAALSWPWTASISYSPSGSPLIS